jgi:hypothetical protein
MERSAVSFKSRAVYEVRRNIGNHPSNTANFTSLGAWTFSNTAVRNLNRALLQLDHARKRLHAVFIGLHCLDVPALNNVGRETNRPEREVDQYLLC